MPVFYRLYQDNRATSSTHTKWFARAVQMGEVDLEKVASKIEENVSVKNSDVRAVLLEALNVMHDALALGYKVNLGRLGSFKVGLKTTAADSAAEFNPLTNVQGFRINWTPSRRMVRSGRKRHVQLWLTEGLRVKELPKNDVKKD